MVLRFILAVCLCLPVLAVPALAQSGALKAQRINGRDYVAVSDVARYYNLGKDVSSLKSRGDYRSAAGALYVEQDSRSARFNGYVHWLSLPVVLAGDKLWMSSVDVLKGLDPVLRQGRSKTKATVTTVMLDAGHGGTDRGTSSASGRVEKEFTLDLSKRVERHLKEAGIRVLQTRTSDKTLTLAQRVSMMEAKKPDLFVSLHFNSGGLASGIETYALPPTGMGSTATTAGTGSEKSPGNAFDEKNVWAAHCIHESLIDAMRAIDRGVRRARFHVLRYAICPAVLVEAGFLSNSYDAKKILDPDYRERLAKAIAAGILKYKKGVES